MGEYRAEDLKKISLEKKMPFSVLLGAAALEDAIKSIGESSYSKYMWLLNRDNLVGIQSKKKLDLNLDYNFVVQKLHKEKGISPGDVFSKELAEEFVKEVFFIPKDLIFDWKADIMSSEKNIKIGLDAYLEGMQIPLTLHVNSLYEEKLVPKKEEVDLLLRKGKKVSVYSFPSEILLAEKFIEIAVKLELLSDLKNYYDIYQILNSETIDGRKVKNHIDELCVRENLGREISRINMILGYKDYVYMKKRWKIFLRSNHSKEPNWEQVMEKFEQFYVPLWEAVVSDTIFFGDWMPELGRFLG